MGFFFYVRAVQEKDWQLTSIVQNTAGASVSSPAISVKDFPLLPAARPCNDQPLKVYFYLIIFCLFFF